MGDETELRSLHVVLPDGTMRELTAESVLFELAPAAAMHRISGAVESTETTIVRFSKRALRMLLGLPRVDGRELLMHHRRRSPHGWRYRDR